MKQYFNRTKAEQAHR